MCTVPRTVLYAPLIAAAIPVCAFAAFMQWLRRQEMRSTPTISQERAA